MRIDTTNRHGKSVTLTIPTVLFLNIFTASIAAHAFGREGLQIGTANLLRLFKELRAYRRQHPDWILVDAQESGGRSVQIYI